ncbi:MAG: AAA family ATPase [Candidatus Falkowbacteria bacterium]|nr:AAA family ATPase [Candidatus Falkowbacteria bacterium]
MQKIIIGLVGEIASGKGTVANYLIEQHKAVSYRFSTPLRDVLTRMHIELNRANLQDVSTILRERFGQDLLAKIIAEDVKKDSSKIIVVDGIRRLADIKYLQNLPEFKLIYVTADMQLRYERITKRGENTDDITKTLEDFKKDHLAETELEIPQVAALANTIISNDNDIKELYKKIDQIIL